MKLNFNFKQALYALVLTTGFAACTSETEFQTGGSDEQLSAQSGIRFVIQKPSPDAVVSRAGTVEAEDAENKVNKMSLYIFAHDESGDEADANYTLLKKKEDITFSAQGEAGTSGTTGADGQLSYTEPITADMIGKKVKILLVANDKVAEPSAIVKSTTLEAFKQSVATAQPDSETSADAVSGNIFAKENTGATGLVMSAVAREGKTPGSGNEAVTLTPLGIDMNASFERIVARIDLIHAIPNMTLKGVTVKKTSSKAYLFNQGSAAVPADAATVSLTPTSGYTEQLSAGITYQPKSGSEDENAVTAKNTYKHMFYLYEQTNGADKCVTVEIKYSLKMGNQTKDGTVNVMFKKSADAGGDYVATTRNTVYTIQMGNGEEATDVNNVTTIKVLDWEQEAEIEETFKPTEDSHSEIITDLTQAEIGDFYMADGTLRKADYQFMESEKAKVIGIVFHKYTGDGDTRFGAAEKEALSGKGVTTPHGLVMAVKLANSGNICNWKDTSTEEEGLNYMESLADVYGDINGLFNYNLVSTNDAKFASHPAFKAVAEFEVDAPDKSTGWFLPSSGQLWDIVENLTPIDISQKKEDDASTYWYWKYIEGESSGNTTYIGNVGDYYAQKSINSHLEKLGNHADLFSESTETVYWTSSEYDSKNARYMVFSSMDLRVGAHLKTDTYYVRPVLAF